MLIVKEIDAIKIVKESISEFFPESSVVLLDPGQDMIIQKIAIMTL